jgi:hypothetical protein
VGKSRIFLLSLFLSIDFEAKKQKNALFLPSGELHSLRAPHFRDSHVIEKNRVKKIFREIADFP